MANRFFRALTFPFRRASVGALSNPGEVGYDDLTGTLRYRDGINNVDRYLGQYGSQIVPAARVRRVTDGTATAASVAITWDTPGVDADTYDTNGMWASANPTRLTIQTPGRYLIRGAVRLNEPTANAWSAVYIWRNGGGAGNVMDEDSKPGSSAFETRNVETVVNCKVGDYFELVVATAGPNNVTPTAANSLPHFEATWLGGPGNVVNDVGTPAVHVSKSTGQTIVSGGGHTAITFDTEDYDTDNIHDNATNNTRLTCHTPGIYRVWGIVSWSANGNNSRQTHIAKNGTMVAEVATQPSSEYETNQLISMDLKLAAGDYVELTVYQESGVNLTVQSPVQIAAGAATQFGMVYLGSGKTVIPRAKIYRSTTASPPSATWSRLTFDAVENGLDNDGMFDSANGRLVCKTAGTYIISSSVMFPSSSGGTQRILSLVVSGVFKATTNSPISSSAASRLNITTTLDLAVGDTIDAWIYQDSGGVLNLINTDQPTGITAGNTNWLSAVKVGQSGPGFNNDPGWAQSGVDLRATNSGKIIMPAGGIQEDARQIFDRVATYSNGWRNYAGATNVDTSNAPTIYKDKEGVVHLGGLIDKNGGSWVSNELIATLPVGYRPAQDQHIVVWTSGNGGASEGSGRLDVGSDGTLHVVWGAPANPVNWLSLANIHYREAST